jgi:membrane protease YdiL (CAAX protease family)
MVCCPEAAFREMEEPSMEARPERGDGVVASGPTADGRRVTPFLVLLFGMGAVFYLLGPRLGDLSAVTGAPLPASALMFVCPALAAAVLLAREDGGIRRWLRAGLRLPAARRAWWCLPAIGLLPVILVVDHLARSWMGAPLPPSELPWSRLPVLVVAYLVSAACEEWGWTGFATELMLRRCGAVTVGAALGSAWALWHVVPYVQGGHDAAWVVWQCVFSVVFRVLLVQLYVAGGRFVVVPVLAHASYNVGFAVFPVAGSHYDPAGTAVGTALAAAAIGAMTVGRRAAGRA